MFPAARDPNFQTEDISSNMKLAEMSTDQEWIGLDQD